jgi:hypothetical protein
MRPTIDAMSALNAATVRGAVALTAGAAGAATRRTGFLAVFRVARRLLAVDVCFLRVVWDVESIGAKASVARRTTAKALSLR